MLTRINGVAFATKEELDEHLHMLEEAKKRVHRKIGREMDLFMMRDEAPGFPFFLPNGMILKNTLLDYRREIQNNQVHDFLKLPEARMGMNIVWCISYIKKTKELGANMIRLAHYPQNEYTVRLAERMGFLLWEEIPIWQGIGTPSLSAGICFSTMSMASFAR